VRLRGGVKAALLTNIREIEIRDVPDPELTSPADVLVRIDAVGVCGSDLHYYKTGRVGTRAIAFPQTLGHECGGTIMSAGIKVHDLDVGQRVAIDPLIACGRCDQCLAGREHTCRRQKFLGYPGQAPGALAEYLVMPSRCCHAVPESMTPAQAALVEPLSVALHSRNLAPLGPDSRIAILGAGPIGLSILLACRAAFGELSCYVTDLIDARLEAARRCGAQSTGNPEREDAVGSITALEPLGLDVVFECAGKQETLDQAVVLLKPGGTLVIVGIPELERVSFDPHALRRNELQVRNVRRQNKCTADAIALIATGTINVEQLVTHRFALAETGQAFDLMSRYSGGVIKALIQM
jgi:L-iditol 2-dehydrogenase